MTKRGRTSYTPYHSLRKIKGFISNGKYRITDKARNTAKEDFGWAAKDIEKAFFMPKATTFLQIYSKMGKS